MNDYSKITIGVIVNPHSGNGSGKVEGVKALREFEKVGLPYKNLSAKNLATARKNAQAAIAAGEINALVVVGGDGMVNLGVNLTASTNLALGIIAAGSGNDSALALGLPILDGQWAAQVVIDHLDKIRKVDAIKVQTSIGQSWAFSSVAAGFDAIVNASANRMIWPTGPSKYKIAMFAELARFKSIDYKVEVDGEDHEIKAMLCTVANSKSYGGGMLIAPEATIDDGFLDLFIVHKITRRELIKVFPSVYTGAHVTHPAVEIVRAKRVKLTPRKKLPAFADGESIGFAPIEAQVMPGALMVFAPRP